MLLNCHANDRKHKLINSILGNRNVFHLNFECKRSMYPNRNNYCFHLIGKPYEKNCGKIGINETNIPGANNYLCGMRCLQLSRPWMKS